MQAMIAETVPLTTDAAGVIRIVGTRVTLDTVITAFREGATAEEIVQQYPTLQLADLYLVIGYYLHRQPEIDAYLAARQSRAATVRATNEARSAPVGIRARLLNRQLSSNG